MAHAHGLSQWMQVVSTSLPQLSRSQADTLAAYSFGIVMTGRAGQSVIAHYLAALQAEPEANVRQRLREWCYAASDQRGRQRQAVQVQYCFESLLRWVLAHWASESHQLVLVCDATNLRQTFTVLAVSLVYRGCALPLAWSIRSASATGGWQDTWLDLLDYLAPAIPADWQVLVLTDRGLYAKWLFLGICAHGWHPLLRINSQGLFRLRTQPDWCSLANVITGPGCQWAQEVICFRTRRSQLECSLLACWAEGYAAPWLIVTDLPPTQAQIQWYRLRAWIEAGFKDLKRGGWRWEQTKMTCPLRAERVWLAMAVATWWVLSVGGEADAQRATQSTAASYTRTLSCFTQGLNLIHVAAHTGAPLPLGSFKP
jgi:hypothetical protein